MCNKSYLRTLNPIIHVTIYLAVKRIRLESEELEENNRIKADDSNQTSSYDYHSIAARCSSIDWTSMRLTGPLGRAGLARFSKKLYNHSSQMVFHSFSSTHVWLFLINIKIHYWCNLNRLSNPHLSMMTCQGWQSRCKRYVRHISEGGGKVHIEYRVRYRGRLVLKNDVTLNNHHPSTP